jgi:Mce-associated membrane protein
MRVPLARRGATDEAGVDRAPGSRSPGAGPDRVTLATRVAAALAAIGLIAVLVFGVMWFLASHGPGASTATARDDAVVAARQIALNLQSLDYNTVDKGLDTWEQSATGRLFDEIHKNRQQYADALRRVQTSSTARVVDVALTDFDPGAGTARAIAAVDVSTTQNVNGVESVPVIRQVRVQLDLVRTPVAGWKAASAGAIRS